MNTQIESKISFLSDYFLYVPFTKILTSKLDIGCFMDKEKIKMVMGGKSKWI